MANWNTEATKSAFDARKFTTESLSNRTGRESGASSISGRSGGFLGMGASGYDIVGIDANKVDSMRESIRTYVKNIETYLDGVDPLADANGAFKGEEVQEAVRKYISTCKEYCKNLTSNLLAFSDQIGDVKNQWQIAMGKMSESINTGSQSYGSNDHYTETIQ